MEEKLASNISTGIRVCLITAHKGLVLQPFPPPTIIAPDSLIVHTGGTWSGALLETWTTYITFLELLTSQRKWPVSRTLFTAGLWQGEVGTPPSYPYILPRG
jgi:hypothetical protein